MRRSRTTTVTAATATVAFAAALLLAGCAPPGTRSSDVADVPQPLAIEIDGLPVSIVTFAPGGAAEARLIVRVAERSEDRAQGLKGVSELPEGVGMLFVFGEPAAAGQGGFWMLDTLIPLDIAFVADGMVVGTATMLPCSAQPCPITHPGRPYDAAVETVAGWLEARGIGIGTPVSWTSPVAGRG
jgi:uncharacterized membrane protein (UPF0127 family)